MEHHATPSTIAAGRAAAHAALATVMPHWPATVDEAMRQPLAASLIRLACLGITLGRWGVAPTPRQPAQALAPARRPPYWPARPATDFKRAAAGDRDEA